MVGNAIVLAAGSVKWRTHTGDPHWLAVVDGVPVLHRTLHETRKRGVSTLTLTNHPEIVPDGFESAIPEPCLRISERILQTQHLWAGTMAILFGDTYLSDAALDLVCASDGLHWFGRQHVSALTGGPGEVFAITFGPDDYPRVVEACEAAMADERVRDPEGKQHLVATYWEPYRYLIGAPLDEHHVDRGDPIWYEVDDWSDDFDSAAHYIRWNMRRREALT